jgi:hypothetical protein
MFSGSFAPNFAKTRQPGLVSAGGTRSLLVHRAKG